MPDISGSYLVGQFPVKVRKFINPFIGTVNYLLQGSACSVKVTGYIRTGFSAKVDAVCYFRVVFISHILLIFSGKEGKSSVFQYITGCVIRLKIPTGFSSVALCPFWGNDTDLRSKIFFVYTEIFF